MPRIDPKIHHEMMKNSETKKLAYQELQSTDQFRFVFIPKLNKIYGVKFGISHVFYHIDKDTKKPVPHIMDSDKQVIGFKESIPTIEEFSKDEYDDIISAYRNQGGT